jgi:hypothetical protein
MKYKILKSREQEELERLVDNHLEAGFQLSGHLIVIIDDIGPWFIQAVILK